MKYGITNNGGQKCWDLSSDITKLATPPLPPQTKLNLEENGWKWVLFSATTLLGEVSGRRDEPKAEQKIVLRSRVLRNNCFDGLFTQSQVLLSSIVFLVPSLIKPQAAFAFRVTLSDGSGKGILDSLGSWFPGDRLRILCQWNLYPRFQSLAAFRNPWAVFWIPEPRISNSTSKDFPSSISAIDILSTFLRANRLEILDRIVTWIHVNESYSHVTRDDLQRRFFLKQERLNRSFPQNLAFVYYKYDV